MWSGACVKVDISIVRVMLLCLHHCGLCFCVRVLACACVGERFCVRVYAGFYLPFFSFTINMHTLS